jgi:hypothetical protein
MGRHFARTVANRAYGFRLANPRYQTSLKLFHIRPAGAAWSLSDPFRDDPELFCIHDLITAHQAESVLEAQFVFSLIVLAEMAPITAQVP